MTAAKAKALNGHDDAKRSELFRLHGVAMNTGDHPKALRVLQEIVALDVNNDNSDRKASTFADVFDQWRTEGPLIHEPTGFAELDELTGGGPVYGTRWYLSGAPDAGKTALLIQIADVFAQRDVTVGLLAVDEEAGDMVTRYVQRRGYARQHCEARDPAVLDGMMDALGSLPIRFYDDRWTIESAAADLAAYAKQRADADPEKHPHGPRAMFGVDSVQTVSCDAERAAEAMGRPMSTNEAVTARTRAVRATATRHRLIEIVTSELNRSTYGNPDPERQTSTMAGGKWSGSIEYSARVLLGLRNVAGETDLLDLEIAKNKHGPRDKHIYLRIDRRSQTLTEASYEPPPDTRESERDEKKTAEQLADAAAAAVVIATQPGLVSGKIRPAVRAFSGRMSDSRADVAVSKLGKAVVMRDGPRRAQYHYLDGSKLSADILEAVPEAHRKAVLESRPPPK